MMRDQPAYAFSHLLERGVSIGPFQYRGRIILLMVDRHHEIRRQVVMRPGGDVLRAMAQLREELERLDPIRPRLELVREPPRKPDPAASERPWEDQLAYHLRIARQRAKHLRVFR